MYSTYCSSRHYITNKFGTELGRWLGEEFPARPGLFVYFHMVTGRWVIAEWKDFQYRKFCDVLNLGYHLYAFGREQALELRRRLGWPVNPKQAADAAEYAEYQENRRMTDESYEASHRRHHRKKVQILTPH